jgi:hypothetical protein
MYYMFYPDGMPMKREYPTRLHGARFQRSAIFEVTAVRISHLN